MATLSDIITDALEITGIKDPNDTLESVWESIGLRRANSILDGWNVDKLRGYSISELEFNLISGNKQYAIGPATSLGTNIEIIGEALLVYGEIVFIDAPIIFDTGEDPRPVKITNCYTVDDSGLKQFVRIVDYKTFHSIDSIETSGSSPSYMWYNPRSPLGEINFYPTPSVNSTIHFDAYFGFDLYSTVGDTVSFPQGYTKLFTYQLAMELCTHIGKPIPSDVRRIYNEVENNVEAINFNMWMPSTKIMSTSTGYFTHPYSTFISRGI